MARVKSKDTAPELAVRRAAHRLGFRFRLHRRELPGSPDLIFPRLKLALFVHGCFWHRHRGCLRATVPKTRVDFWEAKFARNVDRDRAAMEELDRQGWRSSVIWECQCRDSDQLTALLDRILKGDDTAKA